MLWIALGVVDLILEIFRPDAALAALGRRILASAFGRVFLALVWAWLGWHLFCRYGVRPH